MWMNRGIKQFNCVNVTENKMYLHIWPLEPSVPTWSWHSVRTSEAPERYGPAAGRKTVTDISDEVQWQDSERTTGRRSHLLHRHPHPLLQPSRRPVGAAILNEAAEEDYLCAEEDCCSNRPSNWQYWGGCSGRRLCHHGTGGSDTSPEWRCKVVRGIFSMETVEGHLPRVGKGAPRSTR